MPSESQTPTCQISARNSSPAQILDSARNIDNYSCFAKIEGKLEDNDTVRGNESAKWAFELLSSEDTDGDGRLSVTSTRGASRSLLSSSLSRAMSVLARFRGCRRSSSRLLLISSATGVRGNTSSLIADEAWLHMTYIVFRMSEV